MNQLMHRKLASGMALGGLIAAGVWTIIASDNGTAHASTSAPAVIAQIQAASPILTRPQRATDVLPEFLRTGEQALDGFSASTSRYLGSDDQSVRYWVGIGATHQTCLVALLPGDGEFAAMTCADPSDFAAHGLVLQVNDVTVSDRAVYVPDGIDLGDLHMDEVSDQLATGNADEDTPAIQLHPDTTSKAVAPTLSIRPLPAQPAGEKGVSQ